MIVVTSIAAASLSSYRNLPLRLFQIGTKFRDEIRPRFGIIRGREFCMMDMYSFDETTEEAKISYQLTSDAFQRIFKFVFFQLYLIFLLYLFSFKKTFLFLISSVDLVYQLLSLKHNLGIFLISLHKSFMS
jgi:threonyl-tRNA synthetase